ncbi:hypothetical protein B8W95_12690, partial [Staphylococcus pasteuri]
KMYGLAKPDISRDTAILKRYAFFAFCTQVVPLQIAIVPRLYPYILSLYPVCTQPFLTYFQQKNASFFANV